MDDILTLEDFEAAAERLAGPVVHQRTVFQARAKTLANVISLGRAVQESTGHAEDLRKFHTKSTTGWGAYAQLDGLSPFLVSVELDKDLKAASGEAVIEEVVVDGDRGVFLRTRLWLTAADKQHEVNLVVKLQGDDVYDKYLANLRIDSLSRDGLKDFTTKLARRLFNLNRTLGVLVNLHEALRSVVDCPPVDDQNPVRELNREMWSFISRCRKLRRKLAAGESPAWVTQAVRSLIAAADVYHLLEYDDRAA